MTKEPYWLPYLEEGLELLLAAVTVTLLAEDVIIKPTKVSFMYSMRLWSIANDCYSIYGTIKITNF